MVRCNSVGMGCRMTCCWWTLGMPAGSPIRRSAFPAGRLGLCAVSVVLRSLWGVGQRGLRMPRAVDVGMGCRWAMGFWMTQNTLTGTVTFPLSVVITIAASISSPGYGLAA